MKKPEKKIYRPTNRDRLLQTCTYDMLVNMANNAGICPIQAVAGISRETKIRRCYTYVHDGCEQCIQSWLNEDINISTAGKNHC